jgi:hypothetical protein
MNKQEQDSFLQALDNADRAVITFVILLQLGLVLIGLAILALQ